VNADLQRLLSATGGGRFGSETFDEQDEDDAAAEPPHAWAPPTSV
jgi:hypothetical protein